MWLVHRYKGRSEHQATHPCRRATLQSKPKHPNPGKADPSSNRSGISAGQEEEPSAVCATHVWQGPSTGELALNAGAAGTQTATQLCQPACTFRL